MTTKEDYKTETNLILRSFSNLHSSSLSKRDKEKKFKGITYFFVQRRFQIRMGTWEAFQVLCGYLVYLDPP
jgi:hypothetical protein